MAKQRAFNRGNHNPVEIQADLKVQGKMKNQKFQATKPQKKTNLHGQ